MSKQSTPCLPKWMRDIVQRAPTMTDEELHMELEASKRRLEFLQEEAPEGHS